jgi:hypothetical protein
MNIQKLINDMSSLGLNSFSGIYCPDDGYSIRFYKDIKRTNDFSIEFHCISKDRKYLYKLYINDNKQIIESKTMTYNQFIKMYASIKKILITSIYSDLTNIIKPSKN